MKIRKFNENQVINTNKSGWYWVWLKENECLPCYLNADSYAFVPGGIGDVDSNGIPVDEVYAIGPEIIQPNIAQAKKL